MKLTTIICSEELNHNQEVNMKLQAWVKSGLQLVLLSDKQENYRQDLTHMQPGELENALWIVHSAKEWEQGKALGIARMAYDPEMESSGVGIFPEAETVVWGLDDLEADDLDRMYRREHDLPWIIASNEEFILREFSMADMDGLMKLYEDETLYPYVEPLFPPEEEANYEKQYIRNMYHLLGYGMWLVCDAKNGEIIGRAGVENHDFGDDTGLELGYLLRKDYRGCGLAERVLDCILSYVRDELEAKKVICMIHEDNLPSIRLAEKMGFEKQELTDAFLPTDKAKRRLRRYAKIFD